MNPPLPTGKGLYDRSHTHRQLAGNLKGPEELWEKSNQISQSRDAGASSSGLKEGTFSSRAERGRPPCCGCWVTIKVWRGWSCSADPIIFSSSSPGSLSHSLCYFSLRLPEPSQRPPQSFIRGYLDDQHIAHFDSLTRKMEPLVPWMEEKKEKETFLISEKVFMADLEKLSKLSHQSEGLHTWQAVWGCELKEDGSKGGFLHYGYNGTDFISFDKETLRWVAAQPQAQKVKEKWEEDTWWSKKTKTSWRRPAFSGCRDTCPIRRRLCRGSPPVGKVTHKVVNDNLEVLTCQAFGFYPKEIQAIWRRDGEACQYETLHRNVAPNSDGTYYILLSIDIDPKERDRFRCHLEHEGLQKPLVLAFKEET
ncbi:Major histocompatibility complex class I-related protein, partial [Ophiophagus hannah]